MFLLHDYHCLVGYVSVLARGAGACGALANDVFVLVEPRLLPLPLPTTFGNIEGLRACLSADKRHLRSLVLISNINMFRAMLCCTFLTPPPPPSFEPNYFLYEH